MATLGKLYWRWLWENFHTKVRCSHFHDYSKIYVEIITPPTTRRTHVGRSVLRFSAGRYVRLKNHKVYTYKLCCQCPATTCAYWAAGLSKTLLGATNTAASEPLQALMVPDVT